MFSRRTVSLIVVALRYFIEEEEESCVDVHQRFPEKSIPEGADSTRHSAAQAPTVVV